MALEIEANRQKNKKLRFKLRLQSGGYLSEEDQFTCNCRLICEGSIFSDSPPTRKTVNYSI